MRKALYGLAGAVGLVAGAVRRDRQGRFRGTEAPNVGFQTTADKIAISFEAICPLLTHKRHRSSRCEARLSIRYTHAGTASWCHSMGLAWPKPMEADCRIGN